MINRPSLLYYSTNTYLSYYINVSFYGGSHYIWCSPVFNPAGLDSLDPRKKIPASSSPHNIYQSYLKDIETDDRHSALIRQNKEGLRRGAVFKLDQGIINPHEFKMINAMIDKAGVTEFRPIIYLMPFTVIENKLKLVDVDEAANPLGLEYRIENLMNGEFEIVDFAK